MSKRAVLRQERKVMCLPHSGLPQQGRSGTLGLLSQLGAGLEWGREGASGMLRVPSHHGWLGWVTSIQRLDLSGPQSPPSEGQGCVLRDVSSETPGVPRPGGGGERRAKARLGRGRAVGSRGSTGLAYGGPRASCPPPISRLHQ